MKLSFSSKQLISFFLVVVIVVTFSSCKNKKEEYSLYSKSNSLSFDYDESNASFGFSNISSEDITWSASSPSEFIEIDKNSGNLEPSEKMNLNIYINRDLINKDSITTAINISSTLGDEISIEINIKSLPEEKYRMDFTIKDAVLGENKLYILPSNYYDFNFVEFDLESHTIKKSLLGYNGYNYMALSPNEKRIAMVDYYDITIFDLDNSNMVDTFNFNDRIESVVYGPNNILYVFVSYTYDYLFYTIDLNSKIVTPWDFDVSSSDSFIAYLHPSQKYIYALEDDSYNTKFVKIDISNTEPQLVYSESFSNISSSLWWISNVGDKFIFADNRYVNVNPDLQVLDYGDFMSINNPSTSISQFCENSHLGNYYLSPYSSGNYYFNNQINKYDDQFNLQETFYSEDYIYSRSQNGLQTYQYVKASIKKMFFDQVRSELILLTYPKSNSYVQSNGIEIIEM